MCGIVGAVGKRDITSVLIEGLKRLEYRGYDSAGVAVIDSQQQLQRHRIVGKIQNLQDLLQAAPISGHTGVGQTRWATHGVPSERNAHPHFSGTELALVHNGIIENHAPLREQLTQAGYHFNSETDSEIVVHLVHQKMTQGQDFLAANKEALKELEGGFAVGIMHHNEPGRLIAFCRGAPLVIGIGNGEHFIASDHLALLPVTQKFIYLAEGDLADIRSDSLTIYSASDEIVERPIYISELTHDVVNKGKYRHYMQKEIFEQPTAAISTLEGRLSHTHVLDQAFGEHAEKIFDKIRRVQIVACGTSYHAGLVARYWLEGLAGIPCQVEIASEIRYRKFIVEADTLFVTLSQSGETADTLSALRLAKQSGYVATLTICNAPESAMVRESDLVLMTRAGHEIGVASTKAFTTQLTALLMLTAVLGRRHGMTPETEIELIHQLEKLPQHIEQVLKLDNQIIQLANLFNNKKHALFIGRGIHFPIALEGALKLKEISYIHAEAYPAGELKHGPLALVDNHMPIIALAPHDELIEKLKSNLEEVRARGGKLIIFADAQANIASDNNTHVITMPNTDSYTAPLIYTIVLQLLSYHVAVLKGTDVDQPRNLAKSVTVE